MNTSTSLCIPSVDTRITKYYVKNVFNKLNWGIIRNIYFKYKKAYNRNQIFIEFNKWNLDDSVVAEIYQKLICGETIKIVYDDPWFWKCSIRNSKKYQITDKDLLQRKRENQQLRNSNKIENLF